MPLTTKQIEELQIASKRQTPEDIKNLDYVKSKFGFTPPANIPDSSLNLEKESSSIVPAPSPFGTFNELLKKTTRIAAARAKQGLLSDIDKTVGLEGIRTSTLGQVSDLVELGLAAGGLKDMYQSTIGFFEEQKKVSRQNLQILLDNGSLHLLDDAAFDNLATSAQIPVEQLAALRLSKKSNESAIQSYTKMLEAGIIDFGSVPSNLQDYVIQKVDISKIAQKPDIRSVDGGLFNLNTGLWVVPPSHDKTTIPDPPQNNIPFDKDTNVNQIAAALKQIESRGKYDAKGLAGEYGAYQFMPATWDAWSREYARATGLGDLIDRMRGKTLEPTPEMQDEVAKFQIKKMLNEGKTPQDIASIWNSGEAGQVPEYVAKFNRALENQKGAVFETEDGTEVNIATVDGLNQYKNKNPQSTYADMYAFLDTETTLTQKAIENLLDESDYKKSTAEEVLLDKEGFKKSFIKLKNKGYNANDIEAVFLNDNKFMPDFVRYALIETYEGDAIQPWIEKVISEPNLYKITEKGIYKKRAFWPDKLVYKFKEAQSYAIFPVLE